MRWRSDRAEPSGRLTSAFLRQLADKLRRGKSPIRRRAIQRILPFVTARFEAGQYPSRRKAKMELRDLIGRACRRS
jgi:hypothetical protein